MLWPLLVVVMRQQACSRHAHLSSPQSWSWCVLLSPGGEMGAQRGKERAQGHTAGRWQEAVARGHLLTVSPAVAAAVLPWPWWFPPFLLR